jgi:hypothetical protein
MVGLFHEKKSAQKPNARDIAKPSVGFSAGSGMYVSLSEYMSVMGRKGGKKGGKRRLETMTPEERSDFARKAALTRWKKQKRKAGRAPANARIT